MSLNMQWISCVIFCNLICTVIVAYDCIEKCNHHGSKMVWPSLSDDRCLISMPDNPRIHHHRTLPCQISIQANCTGFCKVQLRFAKFNLSPCERNTTYHTDHCDIIDSCEYVIIHESGVDADGLPHEYVTHFHGNLTSGYYTSITDNIRLSFCYRSETFSARNIQMEYKAVVPPRKTTVNLGPPAVYVLCFLVILMIVAIVVIAWCPWLRPCLDPPPQKQLETYDL